MCECVYVHTQNSTYTGGAEGRLGCPSMFGGVERRGVNIYVRHIKKRQKKEKDYDKTMKLNLC